MKVLACTVTINMTAYGNALDIGMLTIAKPIMPTPTNPTFIVSAGDAATTFAVAVKLVPR